MSEDGHGGTGEVPPNFGTGNDSTTIALDGSEAPADSNGETDLPPEILSFTLDGSTTPSEREVAGPVALEVDAVDDVGIDRVEFYAGREFLGSKSSPPYRLEHLITSADNGPLSFFAIAFDSNEQYAESDELLLKIDIAGGQVLEMRSSIADIGVAAGFYGVPTLTLTDSMALLVTGSVVNDPAPGFMGRSYDLGLNLLWSAEYPSSPPLSDLGHLGKWQPTQRDSSVVFGGVRVEGDDFVHNVYRMNTADGALEDERTARTTQSLTLWTHIAAAATDGEIFSLVSDNELGKLADDLTSETWRTEALGDMIVEVTPLSDGGCIVTFFGSGCGGEEHFCIRRLSSTGETEWTNSIAPGISSGEAATSPRPALAPSGDIAVAYRDEQGSHLLTFDGSGAEVTRARLLDFDRPFDLTYTNSNTIVLVGRDDDDFPHNGLVGHYNVDGSEIWRRGYSIGAQDSAVTGAVVTNEGRLFVAGYSDRFGDVPLGFNAEAWIAEIMP
ncbi:MAG: Ig-like domain-containing protein [Myxococcota bacterium]